MEVHAVIDTLPNTLREAKAEILFETLSDM